MQVWQLLQLVQLDDEQLLYAPHSRALVDPRLGICQLLRVLLVLRVLPPLIVLPFVQMLQHRVLRVLPPPLVLPVDWDWLHLQCVVPQLLLVERRHLC